MYFIQLVTENAVHMANQIPLWPKGQIQYFRTISIHGLVLVKLTLLHGLRIFAEGEYSKCVYKGHTL